MAPTRGKTEKRRLEKPTGYFPLSRHQRAKPGQGYSFTATIQLRAFRTFPSCPSARRVFFAKCFRVCFRFAALGAEGKGGGREKGDANLSYASYNYEDLINRDKA